MSNEISQEGAARAAVKGTAVRYLIFFSGKLLTFISTAILARLLTKDDFGLVGFAITASNFLDVINTLGIAPAVVYYPEFERRSITAFWANLIIGFIVFGIAWFSAPLIADYFRDPRASDVIRVMSITYPISSISQIYSVLLSKRLQFNRIFLPEFLSALAKGGTSIIFAYSGLGAWSLVLGQISSEVVSVFSYYLTIRWWPALKFDFGILKISA